MEDYNKRTRIPAFGNWDYEDGLPITQYFESARQAGLLRYNYGEADLYSYAGYYEEDADLYLKPTHTVAVVPPRRKSKTKEADEERIYYEPHVKEQKKQRKVYDVEQTACHGGGRPPKAVDEDLYKIPPELLYTAYPKKNRVVGFFSKCLKPSCAA